MSNLREGRGSFQQSQRATGIMIEHPAITTTGPYESALYFARWSNENAEALDPENNTFFSRTPISESRQDYHDDTLPLEELEGSGILVPLLSEEHGQSYRIHFSDKALYHTLIRESFYKKYFLGKTLPWIHGSYISLPGSTNLLSSSSLLPIRGYKNFPVETSDGQLVDLKKLCGVSAVALLPVIINGIPFMLQGLLVKEIFPHLSGKWTKSNVEQVNVLVHKHALCPCTVAVKASTGPNFRACFPAIDEDGGEDWVLKTSAVRLDKRSTGAYVLTVDIDGCCLSNGRPDARGGVGIFFGPNSAYNVSRPLGELEEEFYHQANLMDDEGSSPPCRHTNQRAEIAAAIHALQQVHKLIVIHGYYGLIDVVNIRSDSSYVVKSITEYVQRWKNPAPGKKPWINSKGGEVVNADLWQLLDGVIEYGQCAVGLKVVWTLINREANMEADQLAKSGAMLGFSEGGEESKPDYWNDMALISEIPPWTKDLLAEPKSEGLKSPPKLPRTRTVHEADWRIMGVSPMFEILRKD